MDRLTPASSLPLQPLQYQAVSGVPQVTTMTPSIKVRRIGNGRIGNRRIGNRHFSYISVQFCFIRTWALNKFLNKCFYYQVKWKTQLKAWINIYFIVNIHFRNYTAVSHNMSNWDKGRGCFASSLCIWIYKRESRFLFALYNLIVWIILLSSI